MSTPGRRRHRRGCGSGWPEGRRYGKEGAGETAAAAEMWPPIPPGMLPCNPLSTRPRTQDRTLPRRRPWRWSSNPYALPGNHKVAGLRRAIIGCPAGSRSTWNLAAKTLTIPGSPGKSEPSKRWSSSIAPATTPAGTVSAPAVESFSPIPGGAWTVVLSRRRSRPAITAWCIATRRKCASVCMR